MKNEGTLLLKFSFLRSARRQAGFTLIEMLVSLAVFSIVIIVSSTALIGLARASDKSHAILTAINNLDFALEQMTRTMRVGRDFYCAEGEIPLADDTQDCPWGQGKTGIAFTNANKQRLIYKFNQSRGSLDRVSISAGIQKTFSITSPEIFINSLRFNVVGSSESDALQTRILIRLSGRTVIREIREFDQVSFDLQTTVSARNLNP